MIKHKQFPSIHSFWCLEVNCLCSPTSNYSITSCKVYILPALVHSYYGIALRTYGAFDLNHILKPSTVSCANNNSLPSIPSGALKSTTFVVLHPITQSCHASNVMVQSFFTKIKSQQCHWEILQVDFNDLYKCMLEVAEETGMYWR